MKVRMEAKKAIMIGSICSASYLAVYVARNILGAASPQMIGSGVFTNENIGVLSSVFFTSYAVGQLVNGAIGEKIKAKYMISLGLFWAGVCNVLFPCFSEKLIVTYIIYGMTGFFLAMIYGPMTKVVAENTEPIYTTRCNLGYTCAALLGSPVAGIMAAFLLWNKLFFASGLLLLGFGCAVYFTFSSYEKKGYIKYNQYRHNERDGDWLHVLLKHRIIKFSLISVITGIVRTTVVFWLPTYLSQHFGFTPKVSSLIFTVSTFVISATPFIAIFLYEKLGGNMDLTILIGFSSASFFFLLVFLFRASVVNIICIILAIMSSNIAASMMFSRYCPSLRDTGMVSTATGFLDFMSYMAASISSTLFANAVSNIGWNGLILIWLALMLCGVVVVFPFTSCVGIGSVVVDYLRRQK